MDPYPAIPLHDHALCDFCKASTALVWYCLPKKDTLAFCGQHAEVHDISLAVRGYEIIKDYRDKTGDDLRRRLLEPAPSVEEILVFEGLKLSYASDHPDN